MVCSGFSISSWLVSFQRQLCSYVVKPPKWGFLPLKCGAPNSQVFDDCFQTWLTSQHFANSVELCSVTCVNTLAIKIKKMQNMHMDGHKLWLDLMFVSQRSSAFGRLYRIICDLKCYVCWSIALFHTQVTVVNFIRIPFIMKIKSNTTNNDLPWRFGLYQRPSSEENETNSSSGSCHSSDVTWQEICRTCGCPHFECAPPLWSILSIIVACGQLIMWFSRLA